MESQSYNQPNDDAWVNRFIILSLEDPGFGGADRGGNSFNGYDAASTANFKIRMGGLPFKSTVKEIQASLV